MSQEKARLGALGEHMVAAQLMQQGWDAYNANHSINNAQSIDLICRANGNQIALIQVKTTKGNGFPTGLTIKEAKDHSFLEQFVVGPWVFVKSVGEKEQTKYIYYILSRQEVVEMIYQSNLWYISLNRGGRKLNEDSVCAILEKWLTGANYVAPKLQGNPFINPLKGVSSKDAWSSIWK